MGLSAEAPNNRDAIRKEQTMMIIDSVSDGLGTRVQENVRIMSCFGIKREYELQCGVLMKKVGW